MGPSALAAMSCWLVALARAQAGALACAAGGSSCEADEESVLLSLRARKHEGGQQAGAETSGAAAGAAREMDPAVFVDAGADVSRATEEGDADAGSDAGANATAMGCGPKALTQAEVDHTLKLHNQLRKAVGVGPLKWNSELQCQAQKWADKCNFAHSNSYNSPIKAGENIGTNCNPDITVLSWFAEFGDFPPSDNVPMAKAGHYTAMTWPSTKEIGCGMCKGAVFVCQYANAAPNVVGGKGPPAFKGTAAEYKSAGLDVDFVKKQYTHFVQWKMPGAEGALKRLR